jgi:hypothetical protein
MIFAARITKPKLDARSGTIFSVESLESHGRRASLDAAAARDLQPPQKKKGTAMRRVIRAFQVEYKNSRKRNSRLVDDPLRLETVASVFGDSGRTGVAKAQPSEQAAKNVRQ